MPQSPRPRPQPDDARRTMTRASAAPLLYLRQLPGWLPPLVMAALLVGGLTLPGWPGALALVVVAAFLAWLGYLSWPALGGRGRLLRLVAVGGVLAIAVFQASR